MITSKLKKIVKHFCEDYPYEKNVFVMMRYRDHEYFKEIENTIHEVLESYDLKAHLSERTLRTWLKRGLRHSRLPSGTILIKVERIDEFLQGYEVKEDLVEEIVKELEKDFF